MCVCICVRIYVCARVGLYVCLCMYMCVCVHSQIEIQGLTYCLVSEGYPRLQKFLAVYQGLKFWVQEQSALVYICNLSTGEVGQENQQFKAVLDRMRPNL